jgi:hypothetical protein
MMVVGDGGNLSLLMDVIIVVLVQQLSLLGMLVSMDVNTM